MTLVNTKLTREAASIVRRYPGITPEDIAIRLRAKVSDIELALPPPGLRDPHYGAYGSWCMMKQRCYNPNDASFARYGGRGIRVCQRWKDSFDMFLQDMGDRPPRHSIGRIDHDRNYEPGNCLWVTPKEQARSRSNNVMLTFRGETMCIAAWAEHFGLPRKTIEKRLNYYGLSVEDALTRPIRRCLITFNGTTLSSAEWARRTGIPRKTISHRLRSGWTVERTLTTPKKKP